MPLPGFSIDTRGVINVYFTAANESLRPARCNLDNSHRERINMRQVGKICLGNVESDENLGAFPWLINMVTNQYGSPISSLSLFYRRSLIMLRQRLIVCQRPNHKKAKSNDYIKIIIKKEFHILRIYFNVIYTARGESQSNSPLRLTAE